MQNIRVFFITMILFLISYKTYCETSVSFSSDISTEFPSVVEYNDFKSKLSGAFNKTFINLSSVYAANISLFPNIIINKREAFNNFFRFEY